MLGHDLASVLGPTFAPLLGSLGKSAAIWFIMLNMFHGTLQPLAGAARTMSQLSDDGLLPRFLSLRLARTDCPWAATLLTAGAATVFLLAGDPVWMIAAANFTYLIGICMPNVAAYALAARHAGSRASLPGAARHHRPRGGRGLDLAARGDPRASSSSGCPRSSSGWRSPTRAPRSTPGASSRTGGDRDCPLSPRRCTSSSPAPCCSC